jgi:hypothetical protein
MFTSLRAEVPTHRPAAVKIIADVTPRASSGLETAPYKMRITAMVISAMNMRPPQAGLREDPSHSHCSLFHPAGLALWQCFHLRPLPQGQGSLRPRRESCAA